MSADLTGDGLLYFTERGSGPPLLLVHGLMVTGEMFERSTSRAMTRPSARPLLFVRDLPGDDSGDRAAATVPAHCAAAHDFSSESWG